MAEILTIEKVTMQFGGLRAVDSVDAVVQEGEIRAIIGPNGAGKTTLLNMIDGFYRPTSGRIRFQGQDITGLPSYAIASRGIARTFQNVRLFKELTILQNIMIGRHVQLKQASWQAILRTPKFLAEERQAREDAKRYLKSMGLEGKENIKAKNVSYGQLKLTEIARALAQQPKVLLLDEPAAGLNPSETKTFSELILRVRDQGITVVLVEHNMRLVMAVADVITVLNFGEKIAEGPPQEIRNNPEVIQAYLGKGGQARARA